MPTKVPYIFKILTFSLFPHFPFTGSIIYLESCQFHAVVAMERWRVALPPEEAPATKAVEDPPPSYSELFPDYAAVPQQSTDSN